MHTLTTIVERYHYDLSFINAIKWWDILQKKQLEYMKTELEIMLGDKNVEPDLQSDLTDTDEEEESGGRDGNETDGNSSSSSSIREVIYDDNACEKYIKPKQLPPISGILTNPPQHLPNKRNIIQHSKLACDKSTTGMSRICQYEDLLQLHCHNSCRLPQLHSSVPDLDHLQLFNRDAALLQHPKQSRSWRVHLLGSSIRHHLMLQSTTLGTW